MPPYNNAHLICKKEKSPFFIVFTSYLMENGARPRDLLGKGGWESEGGGAAGGRGRGGFFSHVYIMNTIKNYRIKTTRRRRSRGRGARRRGGRVRPRRSRHSQRPRRRRQRRARGDVTKYANTPPAPPKKKAKKKVRKKYKTIIFKSKKTGRSYQRLTMRKTRRLPPR